MSTDLNESLGFLGQAYQGKALSFNRGIEREGLRTDLSGKLAQTPHPTFLGSKLTHPSITTDFSESQLELITPVQASADAALTQLNDVHRFIYSGLQDELIWPASMPCIIPQDKAIPLAQYGPSNLGRLKTTYRNGLSNRYGRAMQTICAIHYNFSVDGSLWQHLANREKCSNDRHYRSRRYFDLMRNFRRFSWLPVYLFGASPAMCKSFAEGRPHQLEAFDSTSLFLPDATSLRNGDLGYQSETQSGILQVCYNSLENYTTMLAEAVCTPHEKYARIGLKQGQEYLQVSGNILQSEAEFYTTVRAKCVPPKGANFLKTLKEEGVEYIEIRLLDVNPYLPLGIDETQIHFLDAMLLYCLLLESPAHDEPLCAAVSENVRRVVHHGQQTSTPLDAGHATRSLLDWGTEVLAGINQVAAWLDRINQVDNYSRSVAAQQAKLADVSLTPSHRILADMRSDALPFSELGRQLALRHRHDFLDQPLTRAEQEYFQALATESVAQQVAIENQPGPDFDEYLRAMLATYQAL